MQFKTVVLLITLLFLILTGYFYSNKALSFKFVDEEDNFVFGKYLVWREKLYDDLLSNHQPVTFILSYIVQEYTHPSNIYSLVTRHRQALIFWTFFWSLLLTYYFGVRTFFFVFFFELTKIYLLGNLFLAESFVVYPLLFLVGLSIFIKRALFKSELFILGTCLALSFFLLSPIWPVLLLLLILLILKQKNISLLFLIPGFLIIALSIFIFSSAKGYLNFLFINLTYTLPSFQSDPLAPSIMKSFLSPVISLFPAPLTPTLLIIRILTLILIFNLFFSRKYKKGILILVILGLTNLRFVYPGVEGYSGFHLLPWYGLFIFITLLVTKLNKINLATLIILMIFTLNFARGDLFVKDIKLEKYSINYATLESVGNIIKENKSKNSTLFVSPNEWLIYWQADIHHLPKLYGDYAWMAGYPPLYKKLKEAFEQNPPTFFYCANCKGLTLEKYLIKYNKLGNNLYILSNPKN